MLNAQTLRGERLQRRWAAADGPTLLPYDAWTLCTVDHSFNLIYPTPVLSSRVSVVLVGRGTRKVGDSTE